MVTLAALCLANGLNMHEAGEIELKRIWTKVEQIRAKQAAKPRGSALPIAQQSAQAAVPEGWKLVPIEPTREMVRGGLRSLHENDRDESAILCYRYMLNAAPDSGEG